MHSSWILSMSQSLYGAEVQTSSFSATSPHQDTVTAFYEVLNVMFFMLFATARFKAWPECIFVPCCSAGSVSLVVTSLSETTCKKVSFDCVIICVTHWSLMYFIDQRDCSSFFFFTSLGLHVNCDWYYSYCLPRKRKTWILPRWSFTFTVRCFTVL